jgi:hypothetical protein
MALLPCPYLGREVELTEERERHIAGNHPDLLPEYRDKVAETLADPDQVRQSSRFGSARLFTRWYADVREGKHVVVVVMSGSEGETRRSWIMTAYISRRLSQGEVEWTRN